MLIRFKSVELKHPVGYLVEDHNQWQHLVFYRKLPKNLHLSLRLLRKVANMISQDLEVLLHLLVPLINLEFHLKNLHNKFIEGSFSQVA